MYKIFTTFIAFASIALARTPFNKANSSVSNVLPMGFPPEDLPWSEDSRDIAGNLLLPLSPTRDTSLKQYFKFEKAPTGPIKGSHLIYSISLLTLDCWKDNKNAPIREWQELRLQPYTEILHSIRPVLSSEASEVRALTPLRVGIVYCWMMKELLSQPNWPGLIAAYIYYADEDLRAKFPFGEIIIKDKPRASAPSALTPSKNSTNLMASIASQGNTSFVTVSGNNNVKLPMLQDVAAREKAWLSCFIQIMFKILKYPPSTHTSELMPRDSDISIYTEKPGVFTKNTTKSLDRVFGPVARCSRLAKNPPSSRAMKRDKLGS